MDGQARATRLKSVQGVGAMALGVCTTSALTFVAGFYESAAAGFPLIMAGTIGAAAGIGLFRVYIVLRDLLGDLQ